MREAQRQRDSVLEQQRSLEETRLRGLAREAAAEKQAEAAAKAKADTEARAKAQAQQLPVLNGQGPQKIAPLNFNGLPGIAQ
jgi:hypothetical protein